MSSLKWGGQSWLQPAFSRLPSRSDSAVSTTSGRPVSHTKSRNTKRPQSHFQTLRPTLARRPPAATEKSRQPNAFASTKFLATNPGDPVIPNDPSPTFRHYPALPPPVTRDNRRHSAALLRPPGGIYDVTGPEALSVAGIASRLSTLAGRRLQYEDEPADAARVRLSTLEPLASRLDLSVRWLQEIATGELERPGDTVLRFTGTAPLTLEAYFQLFPDVKSAIDQAKKVYALYGSAAKLELQEPWDYNRLPAATQDEIVKWMEANLH